MGNGRGVGRVERVFPRKEISTLGKSGTYRYTHCALIFFTYIPENEDHIRLITTYSGNSGRQSC